MKYGIVLFPSRKLQDVVNSFRKRYDPHYALVPPHLTLKNPFEIEDSNIDDIADHIHQISNDISPIKLNVYKVSSFHPVNNVIYLKVRETEEMLKLHERLTTGKLQQEETYNFVPHITIAQDLSDDEHSDVLESLRMKEISHEETIDRFQLMYQLGNDSWTVHETFHLGKDC